MPLVRIDLVAGRTAGEVEQIADAVHTAIVEVFAIPPRDRFQIVTEHDAGQMIALDAGLGFDRSSGVVMIQIFTQAGRSTETKQELFRSVCTQLGRIGVDGADVFIGIMENTPADWSFGFGRAQYVEGDLAVPSSE
ncbi:tautomerase family protein [Nocardia sp. NPDC051570]|uniref:tautomerase family protein n=1 Tax=Nocardia sp. NPDC051570 TaxID=3364324 RepID=UPI0037ADD15F